VEVQLPPLCHPKYTSLQAQHEEGKALETFVQSVILKYARTATTDHHSPFNNTDALQLRN